MEIVSRTVEGPIHRYTYGEAERRSRRLARALLRLGIKPGDRVATLAWNTFRHFELYYAISGIGAVCHTINPRLFDDQIAYIVNHAADRLLFVDTTFLPTVERLAPRFPANCRIVVLCDAEAVPETGLPVLPCYEALLAAEQDGVRLARIRRAQRRLAVLHLGHNRPSKGRALQPPLDSIARLRDLASRRNLDFGEPTWFVRWCRCFMRAAGASLTRRR